MKYKLKVELVIREIAGEVMCIPVGEAASKVNGLISLTPSGALLVEKLKDECDFDELVHALLDKYEVTPERAEEDTRTFLTKLKEVELI